MFNPAAPTEKIKGIQIGFFVRNMAGKSLKDWISSWFTSNNMQDDFKIMARYTLWNILKARCSCVFENTQFKVNGIVRLITKEIFEWNENLKKHIVGNLHAGTVKRENQMEPSTN